MHGNGEWARTAVILLWKLVIVSILQVRENAYIEGYLALTLYVIEQVVHDGKKNHILVSSMNDLGYLLRDKGVARTYYELAVHQAGMTISTLDRAQSLEHASGSSAPSMMLPTPSMIRYVGNCFPSVETELKKWGLGVIGDCDVGNRP